MSVLQSPKEKDAKKDDIKNVNKDANEKRWHERLFISFSLLWLNGSM